MNKLRNLTVEEIKQFSSRPGVRVIAVENFLMTISANRLPMYAYLNLDADAHSYKWNQQTVQAIKDGIDLATC